jgi:hypothetical protein
MDARRYGRHDVLIDSENINFKQPERSRLLLNPLNKIKHDGDQKMLPGNLRPGGGQALAHLARTSNCSTCKLRAPRQADSPIA